ncbi:S41 family peptidase [Paenibacillus sp. G2S3]|uniref:S41 family peptidase n=1 Tax=Paenibacillus sp. G2S3 TaxID=3047872 RepID=UPI0024C0F9A6|nr:S41 family peptidase [Paenibacillus sp. G2S3]WHY19144.1 S41 family peptidase [Paenibacillus sp. G2S3]
MRPRFVLSVVISATAILLVVSCNSGDLPGKKQSESEQVQASPDAPVASSKVAEELPEAAVSPLTVEQRLEDFDYMWKIIEENYPFLEVNKRLNGEDWLANKEEYRNKIAAVKTDDEFLGEMTFVLSRLNNGHTNFISKDEYPWYLNTYVQAGFGYEPWINVFQQPNVLARYNQKPLNEQTSSDEISKNNNMVEEEGVRKETSGNVEKVIIEPDQIAYLGMRSFGGHLMEMDSAEIRDFFKQVKDFKTLILDIRGNGGGSSDYWRIHIVPQLINKPITYNTYSLYRGDKYADAFMQSRRLTEGLQPIANIKDEELPKIPPEATTMFKNYNKNVDIVTPYHSVGFKGEIYLLLDSAVYSSAEGFAAFAKGTGFATVVGGRTGGDGLGTDPLLAALPNSGYVFRFSLQMGLNSDGSCNEEVKTVPDIEVDPDTSKPLLDQPAVQKVLQLAKSH